MEDKNGIDGCGDDDKNSLFECKDDQSEKIIHSLESKEESKQDQNNNDPNKQHSSTYQIEVSLGTCKKHRRRYTIVCRNLSDRCGCQGRLYCVRCVNAATQLTNPSDDSIEKSTSKSNNCLEQSHNHDFEEIHTFLSQTAHTVLIDSLNYIQITESLQSRLLEQISHIIQHQNSLILPNKLLCMQLQHDVKYAMLHNNLLGTESISTAEMLSRIHSDKIYEKYSNLLAQLSTRSTHDATSDISQSIDADVLHPIQKFNILQSNKRWKSEIFEGVDRQFAKYFRLGSRTLYVLNQVSWTLDCFDLGLGVHLPAASLHIQHHFPKKSEIYTLNSRLIAVLWNPKTLYIMNIDQPSDFHRYKFTKPIIKLSVLQSQQQFSSTTTPHFIILQQSTKILLCTYTRDSFRCVRSFSTPLITLFKPTVILGCLKVNEFLFVTWFSIIKFRIHNGEIEHVVLSEEFKKRRPNYADLVEFNGEDMIVFKETEKLRRTLIEYVKRISNDAILVAYQDQIEIRSIRGDFQLLETYPLSCDSVALDSSILRTLHSGSYSMKHEQNLPTIFLLTKKKEKSAVYAMHPTEFTIQEVLSVNEIYTKLMVCDRKLYLFKHTYFEVSTKYPGYHSLVLHVYK